MSLNFLLYLRVLIHAVSRTFLLKQRIQNLHFALHISYYPAWHLTASAGLYVHIVHVHMFKLAVLTGTPCCVTQPSIIFFGTSLFRDSAIPFFHFINFFLWTLGVIIVAATGRFFTWFWKCLKFAFTYTLWIATSTWHYYTLEIKLILWY